MAVNITKTFWTGATWDNISKVVFTSPNITSPATAGLRSHILPGSPYIGTWYEAVDYMHRLRRNQDGPEITEQPTYFAKLSLYQDTFDFTSDTTISGISTYPLIASSYTSATLYNDSSNYGSIATVSGLGTTSISGVSYNKYAVTMSGVVGTSTISGSTSTVSGTDSFYIWPDDTSNVSWLTPQTSIMFKLSLGEAYNCRLTAWDDNTHTTTNNKILDEGHYKVHILAYRAFFGNYADPMPKNNTTGVYGTNTFIHPPGEDLYLKGDTSYYGDFDLIFVANGGATGQENGDYLIFTPRLDDMNDTFTSGNYDFVTTLHYQYT